MVFAIIAQIYNWLQPPYMVAGAIGPAPEPRQRRWAPCWLGPPGWRARPPDRSRPAVRTLWVLGLMDRLACNVPLAHGADPPYDTVPALYGVGDFSRLHPIGARLMSLTPRTAPSATLRLQHTPLLTGDARPLSFVGLVFRGGT